MYKIDSGIRALRPIRKTNLSSRTGKTWSKLGHLATKTFYNSIRKRDSLGRALQVPKQSFVLRTGLRGEFFKAILRLGANWPRHLH
jgi:hypothetical protein